MTIIHGDNVVKSRQYLHELVTAAKTANKKIVRLTAAKLTLPELELALGSGDLFGGDSCVIIEELHSLAQSQRKTSLIKFIAQAMTEPTSPEIILWEKRSLTATMLKQFGTAKAVEYKTPQVLFTWLDSLSGQPSKNRQLQLFHQVLETEAAELCLAMLIRQIRMLLQVASGAPMKGAPFMIAKLKKQAQSFRLDQLQAAHQQLLTIDIGLKTGTNPSTLEQQLDLFLLKW